MHESAHAWTADRLGDPTARERGRVSLNPIVHADLFGTVIFPLLALVSNLPLIGWAKPVPVNVRRLHHPRRDYVIVAAAGPASNLALALSAAIALYCATSFVPVRHVPELRAFDPPLIDRIAAADGNLVLVEISPHRDMDSDPNRRSPRTPFDAHWEGLLPGVAGQRFYSQMWDGWVWNVFKRHIVGAGTFAGQAIEETAPEVFAAEMRQWGVRYLFVWTDQARNYLAGSGLFTERWRGGRWSQFELNGADPRSVVTTTGSGRLRNLDFLGGEVELTGVTAGTPVRVRTNYYPAWRARLGDRDVPLRSGDGQIEFVAPDTGDYVVGLEYPRYRWLSLAAIAALLAGACVLTRNITLRLPSTGV